MHFHCQSRSAGTQPAVRQPSDTQGGAYVEADQADTEAQGPDGTSSMPLQRGDDEGSEGSGAAAARDESRRHERRTILA